MTAKVHPITQRSLRKRCLQTYILMQYRSHRPCHHVKGTGLNRPQHLRGWSRISPHSYPYNIIHYYLIGKTDPRSALLLWDLNTGAWTQDILSVSVSSPVTGMPSNPCTQLQFGIRFPDVPKNWVILVPTACTNPGHIGGVETRKNHPKTLGFFLTW